MREKDEKNTMVTASEAFSWNIKKREIHIQLGPCGSSDSLRLDDGCICDGASWDDGCHQRIESIFVSYSSDHIQSIQTVYRDFSNNILEHRDMDRTPPLLKRFILHPKLRLLE